MRSPLPRGSRLARATGAELVLANAYPYDDMPTRGVPAIRLHLREEAQATLDRMRELTAGVSGVRTCTIASISTARGLHVLIERENPLLVVIGSSHRGALGRVFAGTTAERLLHGSPCSVAIVPRTYRAADEPVMTVGVAYDGSPECKAALAAATVTARALGAGLRVIRVFEGALAGTPALMQGPGFVADLSDLEERARQGLEAAVADLKDDVSVEAVLALGDPVRELAAQSEGVDLMFAGSRGYGPLRAVLAGSVSGRLLRAAACPVIVVPRGVTAPLDDLFRATSAGQAA
jgi:nucleotide-binding universal stress UspA family protein